MEKKKMIYAYFDNINHFVDKDLMENCSKISAMMKEKFSKVKKLEKKESSSEKIDVGIIKIPLINEQVLEKISISPEAVNESENNFFQMFQEVSIQKKTKFKNEKFGSKIWLPREKAIKKWKDSSFKLLEKMNFLRK